METLKWEEMQLENTPEDVEKPATVKMRERFTDIFTRKERTYSPTPSSTITSDNETPVVWNEAVLPKRTFTDTSLKVQDSLRNFRRASGEFLSFTIPFLGIQDTLGRPDEKLKRRHSAVYMEAGR